MEKLTENMKAYSLANTDIMELYASSSAFRRAVDSEKYILIDNFMCLCTEDTIEMKDRRVRMKPIVYRHPEKYLLKIKRIDDVQDSWLDNWSDSYQFGKSHHQIEKEESNDTRFNGILIVKFRDWWRRIRQKREDKRTESKISETVAEALKERAGNSTAYLYEEEKIAITADLPPLPVDHTLTLSYSRDSTKHVVTPAENELSVDKEMAEMYGNFKSHYKTRADSFPVMLSGFMKQEKLNDIELGERIHLSDRHIRRFRTGETKPSFYAVLAICIGLQLDLWDSKELLESAFYTIPLNDEGKIYNFFIRCCRGKSVDDCNAFLLANNMDPLTKKIAAVP